MTPHPALCATFPSRGRLNIISFWINKNVFGVNLGNYIENYLMRRGGE
jgi:hypothetical protein